MLLSLVARRFPWFVVLCAFPWAMTVRADDATPPVSTAELCLLLRGGGTGGEVLRDTANRPLLEPLDANVEKLLREAGADTAFIETLRRTRPLATAAQQQAERARQENVARRRIESWEANQEHLLEASRASLEASIAARAREAQQTMGRQFRGKLIVYRDQRIQTYDDSLLANKKLFALYFAKLADPACRKFTPQLIKFYGPYAAAHPEFELIFISKDFSSLEMETDIRSSPMPWPALAYPRLAEEKELTQPGDGPLPRLLVIDGAGHLLMDSVVNEQYVGPQKVLDDLTKRAEAEAAKTDTASR